MSAIEKCIEWKIPSLKDKNFEIFKICEDIEGFRVVMMGLEYRDILRLYFPGKIFYRVLDESYSGNIFKTRAFENPKAALHIVKENSKLIDWLIDASQGYIGPSSAVDTSHPNFRHYLIVTNSLCVDIISTGDVETSILNE